MTARCNEHDQPEPCPVCAVDTQASLLTPALRQRRQPRERPPLFDERNRVVWDGVRRLLIFLLKELDYWYGWKTFFK